MLIKIEEGKFYRTQSGKKVGPAHLVSDSAYGWNVPTETGGFLAYDDYGNICLINRDWGLKEEWLDADTSKLGRDMTPEEKGALLLAEHEGKAIEAIDRTDPSDAWLECFNVGAFDDLAYRVKPELKRETVTLHGCGFYWEQSEQPCPSDTHRITFDTIDGEPDLTSIKMEKL